MATMYHHPIHNGTPTRPDDDQRSSSPLDSPAHYQLEIRQHPHVARVAIGKEKDRKPIDPPPILQLQVSKEKDPSAFYLQSPYFFMSVCLVDADTENPKSVERNLLIGTLVSSLHKLKDTNNKDGGFFVFGDLSVRQEGEYRLKFNLYVMIGGREVKQLATQVSEKFTVYPPKTFPGMSESTFLTRSFSDQGVRLRLRKDSRTMTTRKRNHQVAQLAETMGGLRSRPRLDSRSYDDEEDHHYAPMPRTAPPLTTSGLGGGPLGHSAHSDPAHSPQELSRHNSFTAHSPYASYSARGPPEPRSAHMPASASYFQSPMSYHSPPNPYSMAPSPQGLGIAASLPPPSAIPSMQTLPLGLEFGSRDEPPPYGSATTLPGPYSLEYGQSHSSQTYSTHHSTPTSQQHEAYAQHPSHAGHS